MKKPYVGPRARRGDKPYKVDARKGGSHEYGTDGVCIYCGQRRFGLDRSARTVCVRTVKSSGA